MKIQHFIALLVLSLATVPGARAAVLAGPITNAANGHTYYLLDDTTWTASEAEARGLGGHLVTINDAAENEWVVDTFFPLTGVPYASLWIGLNDAAIEGQFVWASGEPVTFTYWYPGAPNHPLGGDYATIRHPSEVPPTGSWNNLSDTSGLENPHAPIFGVVELPPDPTPLPTAATQPADQFMPGGSARLNGLANPRGSPTLAWFEWGTSLAYGNATPPQSVGSGSNAVGFSNVLVGLVSGTNYHFRARASNAFGFATGVDQIFNLNTQRPIVTTLAADQLTANSARLIGQVNPQGWPTAAWFEWGTGTNYGNVIGMQDVGQGSSVSNLNVGLDGLMSGLNYHYRLVATNAFGAAYGADQMFNTTPRTITWTGADPSGNWSAPANWSPAGVPTNGAALVFPGGLPPGDMVSTNDLTDRIFHSIRFQAGGHTIRGNPMTLTSRRDVIILSGTNVIACDLTFAGTPSTPTYEFPSIWGYPGELTMIGNVGGGGLNVSIQQLVIRGQFTGGSIRVTYGSLALLGDNPHPVSAVIQGTTFSTLRVQGSQPNLNITMLLEMEVPSCPTLTGDGVVGDVALCGTITPDSTLSVKNFGGRSDPGWRVLNIRLNGTNAGEYGKLVASGDLNLGVVRLLPSPSFNPQAGQVFTIIEKTSPGPISNAPLGPEGTLTNLNGRPFRISYVGGDGNDVTLTAQPTNAPTTTNTWTGADPSGYWSAPANWSPVGVPANGNDLVFPGGLPPGDMVSTNDLAGRVFRSITFSGASKHTIRGNPMTLTNRTDCIINSGTNVIACDLTFSRTPSIPQYASIRGSGELTLGNVGGGSLYVAFGMRVVITGQFTGGTVRVWGGTLAFYGDDPSAGSAEVQNSSTLLVQGSRPNLNITTFWEMESAACPFLRGDGVVGDVLGCGHITLDSTLSVKSLGGRGASQYGWRVLDIHLNGTNVGEYGKLISSGDVTLTGASLTPTPGFNPQPGQVFTIVDKTSPGPITTVPGYDTTLFGPEGKIITLNGMPFRLSYVGGDGNDVTLTAQPANTPTTTNTWTGADPSGNWSAPANWSPAGVPVNGNDLVFPGGLPPGDMVSTNDLTGRVFRSIRFTQAGGHTIRGNPITLTNRNDVIVNGGTNVIACDLTFVGTPATPDYQFPSIRPSGFPGELTVIGNVGGGGLYVSGGRTVIRGQFTGGSIRVTFGNLALLGDNPHPVSVEILGSPSSTLRVQGSQPNLNITMLLEMEVPSCPTLTGGGVVGNVTGCGQIDLNSTLSVKNLSLNFKNVLNIYFNGTSVGEYGRLISSGSVSLSNGRLIPSAGFHPQPGQVFTIVEKTSPGPIANAIFGPEGTITNLNGMPFRLSYVGGDGNDVTLTAEATNQGFVPIPIPGLPGVIAGSVAWGDYDNDGRLDVLLTGYDNSFNRVPQLWRNTGIGFSNVTASVAPGLPGVANGFAAWGDYDNDGRLDFLLTGSFRSQLWRNTGAGFSNVTASVAPGLPGLESSSVAWGDYDNDGRLDFLLTGTTNFYPDESPIMFQSQLWRNTGSGFSNVTASVAPGLPGLPWGSVGWGDYDNDGRLDFLLTASFGAGQLWRNTGSAFSNVTASVVPGPPGLFGSSVAWGDYDNDGRLDFLLTDHGTFVSQVWRNTGRGFSNVTASIAPGLPGLYQGSAAWGDYDNDGRLDFLLTGGVDGLSGISQVWRNTGGGFSNVTASVTPGLPGSLSGSSVAWGDYDNDGRLDFLLTASGQLWRNNIPVVSNAPPAAPTGLSSTLSGATVALSWNPPADDRTPSTGLNYNLRIGTTPGASDVLSPMSRTDGLRLLPALGNAQARTNAFMFNLAPGRYYWSVQAVDTSFAGSPFAAEQQFTIATPRNIELLMLGNGRFQFSFTNQSSAVYEVLGTTNVTLPLAQWTVLGPPVSLGGGLYRFTDIFATNHAQRFYRLRTQ